MQERWNRRPASNTLTLLYSNTGLGQRYENTDFPHAINTPLMRNPLPLPSRSPSRHGGGGTSQHRLQGHTHQRHVATGLPRCSSLRLAHPLRSLPPEYCNIRPLQERLQHMSCRGSAQPFLARSPCLG